MMNRLTKLVACLSLLVLGSVAAIAQSGTDWSRAVAATPEGGFVMGNPKAEIRLVEFVSMSCPHCASFDADAHDRLINDYVKPGRVSYEIRNYVRDPFDMTAALVARCGGTERFFALTRRLLAEQPQWISRIEALPQDQLALLDEQSSEQQFRTVADWAGFRQSSAAEGLGAAEVDACLGDTNAINQLISMTQAATETYPELRGVPSFVINGALVEGSTWAELEPRLQATN